MPLLEVCRAVVLLCCYLLGSESALASIIVRIGRVADKLVDAVLCVCIKAFTHWLLALIEIPELRDFVAL